MSQSNKFLQIFAPVRREVCLCCQQWIPIEEAKVLCFRLVTSSLIGLKMMEYLMKEWRRWRWWWWWWWWWWLFNSLNYVLQKFMIIFMLYDFLGWMWSSNNLLLSFLNFKERMRFNEILDEYKSVQKINFLNLLTKWKKIMDQKL